MVVGVTGMGLDVPVGSSTLAARALLVEGTLQIVMFGVNPPAGVAHLRGPLCPIQEGYPLILYNSICSTLALNVPITVRSSCGSIL